MKYNQFSDASSILNDYVLVQDANSPSVLVKKNQSTASHQEQLKESTDSVKYYFDCKYYYFDSPQDSIKRDFVESWKEALLQMGELTKEIFDASDLNPMVEATSKRAFLTALFWLVNVFSNNKNLTCPDIVPSGEGGIDIEWTFEALFVSVQIHKSNPKNDRIYYKRDGSFKSTELNKENLLDLLG